MGVVLTDQDPVALDDLYSPGVPVAAEASESEIVVVGQFILVEQRVRSPTSEPHVAVVVNVGVGDSDPGSPEAEPVGVHPPELVVQHLPSRPSPLDPPPCEL